MFRAFLAILLLGWTCGIAAAAEPPNASPAVSRSLADPAPATRKARPAWLNPKLPFEKRLAAAVEERSRHRVTYDGTGYAIAYPMGDVPANKGTCTDEVVRAFRLVGIDLQQLVHEDMLRKFNVYPTKFHMRAPDPNIDHRRTWNLQTFFNRNAEVLPITDAGTDYAPGDIILWDLDNFQLHIGMVTSRWSKKHKRPLIMHNIARGPQIEDKLFEYKIIGHYRYAGGLKPDVELPPDLWAAAP